MIEAKTQSLAVDLNAKILEVFPLESVYKDPESYSVFTGRNLPSFIKDWLIKCFSEFGYFDRAACLEFIEEKIPRKGTNLRRTLLHSHSPLQIFSRLIINTDLQNGKMAFSIPDLGIGVKEGVVSRSMAQYKIERLHEGEVWGILSLRYVPPINGIKGYVELTDFRPFEPYKVDISYYLEARKRFTVHEWIDLLVRSMETNPDYENPSSKAKFTLSKKLTYISRLLTYVEPNLNMIELAPKGTGKSYIFNNLSKFGWTVSGGIVTRAGIFYNLNTKSQGIISYYDFIALDEIETLQFAKEEDILGAFKNYLENGKIVVGNYQNVSDCGLMLLGNIRLDHRLQPKHKNYFTDLPKFFQSSALIDRIHGFIPGWVLFRFTEDLKLKGHGLNSEYFSEIMHLLRYQPVYAEIVKEALNVPKHADTRDTKAVTKLCTAYLKLLYPHINAVNEISPQDFNDFILTPALRHRAIIRNQLSELDSEFSPEMPNITVRK
jgi:ATP-dependent Lon protease